MTSIGGTKSFRYFKIVSVNNKNISSEGRYKSKISPQSAAKKHLLNYQNNIKQIN